MPQAARSAAEAVSGLAPGASLRRNIFYAVLGMGVFNACQFGVIILLAKFAPPDVLGQVRYSLAIATPIIVFCSLELRGALVADAANEFSFGTYRRLRSLMMVVATVILAAIAAYEAATEQNLAYVIIFAGMCASKLVLSLAEIGWGLFQKRERLDLMALSAGLRGLAMIAAFGVFVPLFSWWYRRGIVGADRVADGAAWAVTLYVVASAGILLLFDRWRIRRPADYDPTWTWSRVRALLVRTFPLGLVVLILHLCNSIPELVIEAQDGGKAALGIFGALSTITLVGNLIVLQAANAAAHRLATFYQTNVRAFLALAAKLAIGALVLGGVLLALAFGVGDWLLRVLYRADYATYFPEFKIIVVAHTLALLTVVFGVLTTHMRLFWLQVPAQVITLVCTVVAAFWLIPALENPVLGGAWTVFIRACVQLALYAVCVTLGVSLRKRVLAARVSLSAELPRTVAGRSDEW